MNFFVLIKGYAKRSLMQKIIWRRGLFKLPRVVLVSSIRSGSEPQSRSVQASFKVSLVDLCKILVTGDRYTFTFNYGLGKLRIMLLALE